MSEDKYLNGFYFIFYSQDFCVKNILKKPVFRQVKQSLSTTTIQVKIRIIKIWYNNTGKNKNYKNMVQH